MSVASTAANRPTKIEISEPLIALASTSRPHLSPPKASVSARCGSADRDLGRALLPLLVAGRQRVDVGQVDRLRVLDTASGERIDAGLASRFGPRNVGGASDTALLLCQSRATRPTDDSTIISTNTATTASETMPTRSLCRRRQAVAHTPRERAGSEGSL